MGAEMTNTSLGTPVTMAPEILNAEGGGVYSDVVDLWSIGVVFYMMLYGNKGPFKFKTYADLQEAVKDQSGKNLKFGNGNVSDMSKDLLRKLIEPNPSKRIGWEEFYNHPLFAHHTEQDQKGVIDVNRSIMIHGAKDKVNDLWNNNRKRGYTQINKVDVENINVKEMNNHIKPKAPEQYFFVLKFC